MSTRLLFNKLLAHNYCKQRVGVGREKCVPHMESATQCLLILFSFVALLSNCVVLAGNKCLGKCDCFHKSNKLIANCVGLGLTKLPEEPKEDHLDIQVLNLSRNNFGELRKNIFYNTKLLNLQRISLRKVGLESIDKMAFYRLLNLIELDVSTNSLKFVPSESFESIVNLRFLDLSSNQIETLSSQAFIHLEKLQRLSLERNHIKTIDETAFVGLRELEELKLSDNHLSFLGSHSLLPLIKVHSLTLSGNKWLCDCRMRQLREYLLMNTRINVPDNPKCNNLNKIWTQLGLNDFLCAPRISPNDSSKVFKTEAGHNLTLECSFYVDNGYEAQVMPIKWFWQERILSNNSEGVVPPQKFTIYEFDSQLLERTEKRKIRTSRLEIIYILELNKGAYGCQARNEAGFAGHNFTVEVASSSLMPTKKSSSVPAASAAASIERDNQKNSIDNSSDTKSMPTANSVVIGLVLGILFGIFLVLVLFGIVVVLLCRRRQYRRRSSLGNNRVVAVDSELEKLTASTISGSTPSVLPSCPSTVPSVATTIVNPVQKPPRLAFSGTPATPTGTPQVWLIKRNNDSANGILRSDGDGCCETSLPLCEYDIESYAALTAAIEPDLIHNPSTFMRNNYTANEEQISVHSDGTEV